MVPLSKMAGDANPLGANHCISVAVSAIAVVAAVTSIDHLSHRHFCPRARAASTSDGTRGRAMSSLRWAEAAKATEQVVDEKATYSGQTVDKMSEATEQAEDHAEADDENDEVWRKSWDACQEGWRLRKLSWKHGKVFEEWERINEQAANWAKAESGQTVDQKDDQEETVNKKDDEEQTANKKDDEATEQAVDKKADIGQTDKNEATQQAVEKKDDKEQAVDKKDDETEPVDDGQRADRDGRRVRQDIYSASRLNAVWLRCAFAFLVLRSKGLRFTELARYLTQILRFGRLCFNKIASI